MELYFNRNSTECPLAPPREQVDECTFGREKQAWLSYLATHQIYVHICLYIHKVLTKEETLYTKLIFKYILTFSLG